ncbi:MAG: NAD(P)-binding protein, partial [Myxococcota bacterium]|nr:NAD(P)-binding protein [Myxococcota bacterium]
MPDRPIRIAERYPLVQDPPFTLDGTRTLLFVLPCDPARLDALLARTFAWAAPELEIERLGRHCILAITDVARAEGADPALGWFAYREATFFVPIWGRRAGAPFVALHVPFIYPDQGLAVAAGREIYGLPKKPARIELPSDADLWSGARPISASALAAQAFDGSQWTEQTLFTISSTPQPIVPALADTLLDAIELAIGALPGGLGPIGRLLQQDLVQLKQVPDVTPGGVPARVLHRAVTRVAAPVRALSNVRVADASKVRIDLAELASEPIRDVLGLPASVAPIVAATMTMDFAFEPGEVWLERPEVPTPPAAKKKVVILGGGMGALATAHALSDTDAKRAAYDVRVLVQGHLLGGKGANARNPARAQRIEEHGLHVIFGFYHNFLRLMRSVYADAARPATVEPSTFEEAFEPEWRIVFHDGASSWEVVFPRTPATYGAG